MTEHCPWSSDVGAMLRRLRKDAGLSLREAAERAGLHFTYLSRIENSKFAPPSCDALKRLAAVYDDDPDVLLAMCGRLDPQLINWLVNNLLEIKELRTKMESRS